MDRFAISTQFIGQHQCITILPAPLPMPKHYSFFTMNSLRMERLSLQTTKLRGEGKGKTDWESEAGVNLTFSVIIYPELMVIHQFYLNIIASLAVADALLPEDDIKIKWPNDILLANQKLCGILIQNNLKTNKIQTSVIGIGINVNQTVFSYTNVTSLALMQEAKPVEREEHTVRCIGKFRKKISTAQSR